MAAFIFEFLSRKLRIELFPVPQAPSRWTRGSPSPSWAAIRRRRRASIDRLAIEEVPPRRSVGNPLHVIPIASSASRAFHTSSGPYLRAMISRRAPRSSESGNPSARSTTGSENAVRGSPRAAASRWRRCTRSSKSHPHRLGREHDPPDRRFADLLVGHRRRVGPSVAAKRLDIADERDALTPVSSLARSLRPEPLRPCRRPPTTARRAAHRGWADGVHNVERAAEGPQRLRAERRERRRASCRRFARQRWCGLDGSR